jgi:hypothetical protein
VQDAIAKVVAFKGFDPIALMNKIAQIGAVRTLKEDVGTMLYVFLLRGNRASIIRDELVGTTDPAGLYIIELIDKYKVEDSNDTDKTTITWPRLAVVFPAQCAQVYSDHPELGMIKSGTLNATTTAGDIVEYPDVFRAPAFSSMIPSADKLRGKIAQALAYHQAHFSSVSQKRAEEPKFYKSRALDFVMAGLASQHVPDKTKKNFLKKWGLMEADGDWAPDTLEAIMAFSELFTKL